MTKYVWSGGWNVLVRNVRWSSKSSMVSQGMVQDQMTLKTLDERDLSLRAVE